MLTRVEEEEEYISNKLHKQLHVLAEEKAALEERLFSENGDHEARLRDHVTSAGLADRLNGHLEEQLVASREETARLRARVTELENENFLLNQRVLREREQHNSVLREKVDLATSLELDNERLFNATPRRRSSSAISVVSSDNGPSIPNSPVLVAASPVLQALSPNIAAGAMFPHRNTPHLGSPVPPTGPANIEYPATASRPLKSPVRGSSEPLQVQTSFHPK